LSDGGCLSLACGENLVGPGGNAEIKLDDAVLESIEKFGEQSGAVNSPKEASEQVSITQFFFTHLFAKHA
jgi:hypothetical protein